MNEYNKLFNRYHLREKGGDSDSLAFIDVVQ